MELIEIIICHPTFAPYFSAGVIEIGVKHLVEIMQII